MRAFVERRSVAFDQVDRGLDTYGFSGHGGVVSSGEPFPFPIMRLARWTALLECWGTTRFFTPATVPGAADATLPDLGMPAVSRHAVTSAHN